MAGFCFPPAASLPLPTFLYLLPCPYLSTLPSGAACDNINNNNNNNNNNKTTTDDWNKQRSSVSM